MYEYSDPLAFTGDSVAFFHRMPETTITMPYVVPSAPPQLLLPVNLDSLAANEFESAYEALGPLKSEAGNSSSSCGSYGSPGSLLSCNAHGTSYIQRSMSSHSLRKDEFHHKPTLSSLDVVDSETYSMRKVFSTGDLQGINSVQYSLQSESSSSHENYCTIEGSNKVCRYSAEERKERIERYRSKRNHRNFTKKIKYACRKTLADSRPRIRGRFARNEDIVDSSRILWGQMRVHEDEEDDDFWINFLGTFSENTVPEC